MKRLTAWLLTLGIIVAIVANSTDFFFHRPYYEYWDLAANSLDVRRAKHFSQLYGVYSRWGFHHPGPLVFYIQAFGEWLFYDLLHLTPAPFNAQTLINLCVTTSYFVAALTVFSRWLTAPARRWFIPGALALAALLFGNVDRIPTFNMLLGSSVFSSAWTAHNWVFPFLCVLVAGASVANGRGQDLPVLVLGGGFILHAHISSPLFVGPPTLLAYAGLLATAIRRERAADTAGGIPALPRWRRLVSPLGAAWRAYPRIHVVTVAMLALFALPFVIDIFRGDASNIHLVLKHMRDFHGKHKSFARAVFYFVQYGAFRPYTTRNWEFTRFNAHGAYTYLWFHKKIYAAWIAGLLLMIWACAVRPALIRSGRWRDDEAATPADGTATSRTSYLAWCGIFLLLGIALAVYWGILQDGLMMYYSGWLNYSIYYFGLLIVMAELSSVFTVGVRRWGNGAVLTNRAWPWIERLVPAAVVVFACVAEAGRFRVQDPSPEMNRAMHEGFVRAIRDAQARNPKGIKILDFPYIAWPAVTGLALEMEREGHPFKIATALPFPFPTDTYLTGTTPEDAERMEVWHFTLGDLFTVWVCGVPKWGVERGELLKRELVDAEQAGSAEAEPMFYPMINEVQLRISLPRVDPNAPDGASIDMRRGKGVVVAPFRSAKRKMYAVAPTEFNEKYPGCALYGFSPSESWGTWNEGPTGALRLRGEPVKDSDNVEITFDAHPFLAPEARVTSQRMSVALDRTLLGPEVKLRRDEQVAYTVPGSLWNRTFGQSAGAALQFDFPDVASPAACDPVKETDGRLLGVGLRGIHFRTVEAVQSQPALGLEDPEKPVELDFKAGGNAPMFQAEGWWQPEPWGTWSRGHASILHFHSHLVEGTREVEITLNLHSVMGTDSAIKGQRIRASLGDIPIDPERTVQSAGSLVLTVPATIWNSAVADDADAKLKLELPDAVAPSRLDPTGQESDQRQLAIGVESIRFRAVAVPTVTSR